MFKNMTIKKKLMILSFLAIATIFLYAAFNFLTNYKRYKDAVSTLKIVTLSVKMSNVLHELQKERGASAGFLNSKGKSFGDILAKQRKMTDQKLKILQDFLKKYDNQYINIAKKNVDFSGIKDMRKKVDALAVTTKKEVGYYTAINRSILNTISRFSTIPKDHDVRNLMNSLILFISSKERAGIERAVLSGAFARDKFTHFLYYKFVSVLSQQKALLDLFESSAPKTIEEDYQKIKSEKPFKEVEKMRNIALSRDSGFGINATYWFKTITKKINLLKKMEDDICATLINSATNTKNRSLTILITVFLLSLFVLIVIAVVSRNIIGSILRAIDRFKRVIKKINEGDLSIIVERRKVSRNEMDEITRELDSLVKIIRDVTHRINTSVDLASKGDFSYDLNDKGLHGEFATAIHMVQSGIAAMKDAHKRQEIINFSAKVREIGDVGKGLSLIQSETSNLVDNLSYISSSTETTSEQSTQSLKVLEDVLHKMESLSEQINDTNISINELNEMSNEITSVVVLIKDIAEQTNLLSLNAAIEAARAGEHGRGFAVVADEVRKLAERTAKATNEINVSINTMKQETDSIVSKSETMKEVSDEVSEVVSDFKNLMEKLEKDSRGLSNLTDDMKNQVFLILAKIDHIIFKADAYNAIVNNEKDKKLGNENECKLGLWYNSEGKKVFGKAPSYAKINTPHKRVHKNVAENMKFIQGEDRRVENENIIIDNFIDMEKASHELYELFDRLREEIKSSDMIK
ncbi:MAG: chemotaxis protein [Epsilonproteobacteria bacterium]|nr:chemotaxis protein [Campylobacterota bacterium]